MRRELSAVSPEPSRARAGGEDRSTAVSIALCACQQCLPARFIYSALWVLSFLKPPPSGSGVCLVCFPLPLCAAGWDGSLIFAQVISWDGGGSIILMS